jgi:hypothetical protein
LILDLRLRIEPQRGIPIVNQQAKINNQKFFVDRHPSTATRRPPPHERQPPFGQRKALGCPSQGKTRLRLPGCCRQPAKTRFQ